MEPRPAHIGKCILDGSKTILEPNIKQLQLGQWEVYEKPLVHSLFSVSESLNSLLAWLRKQNGKIIYPIADPHCAWLPVQDR